MWKCLRVYCLFSSSDSREGKFEEHRSYCISFRSCPSGTCWHTCTRLRSCHDEKKFFPPSFWKVLIWYWWGLSLPCFRTLWLLPWTSFIFIPLTYWLPFSFILLLSFCVTFLVSLHSSALNFLSAQQLTQRQLIHSEGFAEEPHSFVADREFEEQLRYSSH